MAWPSISAGPWGAWLGRVFSNRVGIRVGGVPVTVGWMAVIAAAPLAGALYLHRKAPRLPLVVFGPVNSAAVRYRLTTARVLIERPAERAGGIVASLALGDFDAIDIEVQPGQGWFRAADVVFMSRGSERLRLAGTPDAEPFVKTVLQTRQAMAP